MTIVEGIIVFFFIIIIAEIIFAVILKKKKNMRINENIKRLNNLIDRPKIISGKFGPVSIAPGVIGAIVCFILALIQFLITVSHPSTYIGYFWCVAFIVIAIASLTTMSSQKSLWETAIFYVTEKECVLKTTNKIYNCVIPIADIETITIKGQKLMILSSGQKYAVPYLNNIFDVKEVIEKIKNGETVNPIEDNRRQQTVTTAPELHAVDNTEIIRKYKKLLDDGIITKEEFEAKKKQLLDLI